MLKMMKASSVAEEAETPTAFAVPLSGDIKLQKAPSSQLCSTMPLDEKIEASSPMSSDTCSSSTSTSTDSTMMNPSLSGDVDENDLGSSDTFTARARASILDRLMDIFYSLPVYDSSPLLQDATGSNTLSFIEDTGINMELADAANGNASKSNCRHGLSSEGAGNEQRNGKRRASQHRSDKSNRDLSENEDDDDDGDDDGGKHPRQKKVKLEEGEPSKKRLACPFFKHNPRRYQEERSCVGPGWRTVHRLK